MEKGNYNLGEKSNKSWGNKLLLCWVQQSTLDSAAPSKVSLSSPLLCIPDAWNTWRHNSSYSPRTQPSVIPHAHMPPGSQVTQIMSKPSHTLRFQFALQSRFPSCLFSIVSPQCPRQANWEENFSMVGWLHSGSVFTCPVDVTAL